MQPKPIDERIRKRTEELIRKNTTEATKLIEREFFPRRSNDVKEYPKLTLVVMSTDYLAQEKATLQLMETIVRESGTSGRTFKSALIFTAVDPAENLQDKAREALAWEDIDDDSETKKQIDPSQTNLLARNLKNAQRDLDESIFRAYRHLYLLGKDNKLKHIDLGSITSSSAGSLVEIYLQRLGSNGGLDEIVDAIPARKLITYWPASMNEWSTKAVRDAFYSSPLLPRLINLESIKRTIAAGVTDGLIGYAIKDSSGRLKLQKLKESLFDADVEISEDVYILKADEAQKLREPPRLAHLVVRPEHVVVKPGEKASFSYSGLDQYGQPIMVAEVEWTATGGSIDSKGHVCRWHGRWCVHRVAKADGSEAIAEVRIATKDEIPEIVETSGPRTIRWSGNVPPQKWMQFYTKVLSKYATSPELKIEVSFQMKVEPIKRDAKAAETKTGLRELGLDDDVALR